LKDKAPKQAEKLLNVRHFTFGKSVSTIVAYEEEHGREDTLSWLREQSKGA
jgi:hypothetical protein